MLHLIECENVIWSIATCAAAKAKRCLNTCQGILPITSGNLFGLPTSSIDNAIGKPMSGVGAVEPFLERWSVLIDRHVSEALAAGGGGGAVEFSVDGSIFGPMCFHRPAPPTQFDRLNPALRSFNFAFILHVRVVRRYHRCLVYVLSCGLIIHMGLHRCILHISSLQTSLSTISPRTVRFSPRMRQEVAV